MKNVRLITTTGSAIAFALSSGFADGAEIIDTPKYTRLIEESITNNCPQTINEAEDRDFVETCLTQSVTSYFTIATDMGKRIDKLDISAEDAQTAKGMLQNLCFTPVDKFGGRTYKNLSEYLDASYGVIQSCEQSMESAGAITDIDYQPSAREFLLCHIKMLKGYGCGPELKS